ncbi:hypothetical protein BVC80_1265g37 [Macleaya cordata]|uniref:Uncharacterized protein n=1 Tax=Macleaya cordata TaxID=56857 RepID=A0A200PV94_MACCD|nr:hypothetical protein BVC80_1265g37 [Macleaya cordata]
MEIREKYISVLQMFFLDGVIPRNTISDEDEEVNEIDYEDEQSENQYKESALQICDGEQLTNDILPREGVAGPVGRGKKRHNAQEDDNGMSGSDQVLSSSSRFASPEHSRVRKSPTQSTSVSTSESRMKLNIGLNTRLCELLKDGRQVSRCLLRAPVPPLECGS